MLCRVNYVFAVLVAFKPVEGGGWTCVEPAPDTITYGSYTTEGTALSATVTYSCDAGYQITSGSSFRTCNRGVWSGSLPACGDIDECATNPCQNSGVCTNLLNAYTCACSSPWTGTNCDTPIDNCWSSPCQNSGVCSSLLNGYSCACTSPWTGTNCDAPIDNCWSSPCQNSGVCSSLLNGYSCACTSPWTGTNCDAPAPCSTPVDVSQATLSFSNTLHGSTATYTCDVGYEITSGDASRMCSYGSWSGSQPTCGDIDECATNPCQNSGVCSNLLNAYSCACASQWSGTNCDTLPVNCKKKYTTAIFCAHSKGHLQCPKGKKLYICDADYGRTAGSTICDNGKPDQTSTTNCTSNPQTFESVSATCNNQAICNLEAENSVYGDPCVETWKYLEIKYRCVVKKWRGFSSTEH